MSPITTAQGGQRSFSDTLLRIQPNDQDKYIKKIGIDKATGPDGVPMSLIREKQWWPMLYQTANTILQGKGTPGKWSSRLVLLDKRKTDDGIIPSSDDIRQIAVQNLVVKLAEHRILE
jgi:hypothetical protein